ncbi:MAG: imidazoleglycerol-phosphate dehydratase HisB [Polyangiaceae bacterium]|nr:imidazoleglycerol-phosphate dehydratase HisB [Polyangiaceae bacterium]
MTEPTTPEEPSEQRKAPAPRTARVARKTRETDIALVLCLDGAGVSRGTTGLGFLDHMLATLVKHARFDLEVSCHGDLVVDDHHSAEDVALALGQALDEALGDRRGIARFGHAHAPLDEALARAVVDLSGRPWSEIALDLRRERLGTLACENLVHVLRSLATAARLTLHVDVLRGDNDHHKAEAAFKAVALALRQAVARDGGAGVPSTKGVL